MHAPDDAPPEQPIDKLISRSQRIGAALSFLAGAEKLFGPDAMGALAREIVREAEALVLEASAYADTCASAALPRVVEETLWVAPAATGATAEPAGGPPKRGRKPRAAEAAPATAAPAQAAASAPAPGSADPKWATTPDGKPWAAASAVAPAEPAPGPAPPEPAVPAPAPSEPKRMTGPERHASTEPTGDPESAERPSLVSPDAERVLKETGDASRAIDARRAAEAAAQAPAPASVAASPASKLVPSSQPENAIFPFRAGPFQNRSLESCTIEELEALVGTYAKLVPAEQDADARALKASWLERVLAWHRYRLDAFLASATPDALMATVDVYEALASAGHAIGAVVMHRKAWHDRATAWARERGAAGRTPDATPAPAQAAAS